jgi:UDP-GlcNAc:undecaprenyl-phosphate GlcNAc-1-phosphate transferase
VNVLAPVFLTAALAALVLTPMVRALAHRVGALDHPGGRRAHQRSMPRLGGVAIAIAWAGTLILTARYGNDTLRASLRTTPLVPILSGGLLIFMVGLVDDLRPVPASIKLLAEVLAALAVVGSGMTIEHITVFGTTLYLGWLSASVTVLWILGITNAFNLVDGLDGLATGLAIIAGITCAAIVVIRDQFPTAIILMALLGGLVGFLPFNFNPASIFLGDCGSLLVGFVLAVTAITGWQKGATALAVGVPLLVFALPIVDITTTVVRRLRSTNAPGLDARAAVERVLRPDREHIHHRLVTRGLSPRAAVLVLYAIAVGLSCVALLTMERP